MRLSLKQKVVLSFGSILAVLIVLVGVSLVSFSKLAEAERWNTHTHKVLGEASQMLTEMVNIETGMRGFVISGKDSSLEPFTGGKAEFKKHFDTAKSLTSDNAKQQGRLDRIAALHTEFVGVADALIQMRRDVSAEKLPMDKLVATFSEGRDKKSMDAFRALAAEFAGEEESLLAQRSKDAEALRGTTRSVLLIGGVLATALSLAIGFAFARGLLRQLGGEPDHAVEVVNRIASGDLTTPVQTAQGDTSSVMAAMHRMQVNLVELVHGIAVGSEQIRTASQEVARGNLDLSSRTEQQASSLQETASSMEQITGNVRQAADNAQQANKLAQAASDSAERGGHKIGSVESTMQDIAASSAKVENIIGVIDGIAFQTNILALNAAVEAARAGEQGRGFAVVAAEVRSLAQRSADAAREIKQLIQQSTAKVGDGSRQVAEASDAMREILAAIRNASTMMSEITAGTAEQLSGIEQVNQAVAQLDAVTQQNAALVEEASAATQSMEQQSTQLSTAIQAFKV